MAARLSQSSTTVSRSSSATSWTSTSSQPLCSHNRCSCCLPSAERRCCRAAVDNGNFKTQKECLIHSLKPESCPCNASACAHTPYSSSNLHCRCMHWKKQFIDADLLVAGDGDAGQAVQCAGQPGAQASAVQGGNYWLHPHGRGQPAEPSTRPHSQGCLVCAGRSQSSSKCAHLCERPHIRVGTCSDLLAYT